MADDDTAGILAEIRNALSKLTTQGQDDGDDYAGEGRVPHARLRRVLDERNALRQQLADMAGKVEQLEKGYQSQVEALKTETAEQVKSMGLRHQEDLALVEMGLKDPLGRAALRQAWEHQPKDSRGKSVKDWWQSTLEARAAHHADPEKGEAPSIPGTLTGYLPKLEDPAPAAGDGRQQQRTPPPSGPGKRVVKGLDSVPTDQGMDAFFQGLGGLGQ